MSMKSLLLVLCAFCFVESYHVPNKGQTLDSLEELTKTYQHESSKLSDDGQDKEPSKACGGKIRCDVEQRVRRGVSYFPAKKGAIRRKRSKQSCHNNCEGVFDLCTQAAASIMDKFVCSRARDECRKAPCP